jgi:hypothetical protein
MTSVEPPPIVPTAASEFTSLRGRRVIVGLPGLGFRNELRADDPVVHKSHTHVPILTEHDYYRAEMDEVEAFAILVPIERVWVEVIDDHGILSWNSIGPLDRPPTVRATAAANVASLMGRRVVHEVPDGFVRDLRAVSPVYSSESGPDTVGICGEADWYRWGSAGSLPAITQVDVSRLWVE